MDRFEPNWDVALRYLEECHADWMDASDVVPTKKNEPQRDGFDSGRYRERSIVEQFFG